MGCYKTHARAHAQQDLVMVVEVVFLCANRPQGKLNQALLLWLLLCPVSGFTRHPRRRSAAEPSCSRRRCLPAKTHPVSLKREFAASAMSQNPELHVATKVFQQNQCQPHGI